MNKTKFIINGFEVEIPKKVSAKLKMSLKDIKEFSKRKTSFSYPVSFLHTSKNSQIFGEMFNINEENGFDKNSKVNGVIIDNGEIILEGLCKLDKMNSESYDFIFYKDEVNLSTIFGDKLIKGNVDENDDVQFSNLYSFENTRTNLREQFLRKEPRVDGKGINFGFIKYSYNYRSYGNYDFLFTPSVAVRELLEELLKKQNKTISFSPEIEKYINHLYMPFNGDYNDLCTPWKVMRYNVNDTTFRKATFVPMKVIEHLQINYNKETDITPNTGDLYYMPMRNHGTYKLKCHFEVKRDKSDGDVEITPKVMLHTTGITPYITTELELSNEDTSIDNVIIKLPDTSKNSVDFVATFTINKGLETTVNVGVSTDDLGDLGKLSVTKNSYIEITKLDGYYNEDTPNIITTNKILPQNYKQKDLFDDVVNTFNANVSSIDNNIHLSSFNDFNDVNDIKYYDWSDKVYKDSLTIKTLQSTKKEVLNMMFLESDDFYQNDYKEVYNEEMYNFKPIIDGTKTLVERKLNYSATTTDGDTPQLGNVALIVNKDNVFSTVMKPRMLFVDSYVPSDYNVYRTWGADKDGNRDTSITNYVYYTNRFNNNVDDENNLKLVFKDDSVYKDQALDLKYLTVKDTNINLYNKFYKKESDMYDNPDYSFLKAKFNLNSKDISNIKFNDIIFIDLEKNGRAYYRLNSINGYKTGSNDLTEVELIQIEPDFITTKQNITTSKELKFIKISKANQIKKDEAQGISGGGTGTGNGSGLTLDEVTVLIAEGISGKLDVDGKAVDSDKLDGIDSDKFARKDLENTFDKNQTFLGDVDVLGDFNIRNTVDLSVSDNIIDLNKGENGPGVTVGYAGIQIDRGILASKGLIFDESDDKIKFGDFDTRQGTIKSVGNNSFVLEGLNTSLDITGKKIKLFTKDQTAKVFIISSWNNVSKVLGVSGSTSGIDDTWKWRILLHNDLQQLLIGDYNLVKDNGVIWDGNKLTDAGYKWALKNGDINEDFNGNVITAFEALQTHKDGLYGVLRKDKIYSSAGGTDHKDLGLNFDKTILANDDGTLQAINLHSNGFISGIGGKGTYNIGANSEMDNLSVRESLTVNTFVNNKINIHNGDMIVSDSVEIKTAVYNSSNGIWKINTKENIPFSEGDKVRCQYLDGNNVIFFEADIKNLVWFSSRGRYKEMEIAITDGTGTPKEDQLLTRWSGGLLYLNSSDKVNGAYLDVLSGGITKARFGHLTGINDPDFGQLQGDGAYIENLYGKGDIILGPNSSIDFANVKNAPKEGNRNLWILKTVSGYYGGGVVDIQNVTVSDTRMIMYNSPANYVIGNRITMPSTDGGNITVSGKTSKAHNYTFWQAYDANNAKIGSQDQYHQNTPDHTFKHTITLPVGTKYVEIGLGETTNAKYFYTLNEVKVELGNTKSSWSLSPEDAGETNPNFMLDSELGKFTNYVKSTKPTTTTIRTTTQDGYPCMYFDNVGYYTQTAYLSVAYREVPKGQQTFTVSMDIKTNSEQTIYLDFDGGINTSMGLTHNGGWQRVSKTFSFNVPSTTGRIAMYSTDTNSTFTGFVKNVKLEVSTIPTPWIASTQDVVHKTTHIDSGGIYSGSAVLGGFDIDETRIRSRRGGLLSPIGGRVGHISMSNTTTAYGGNFDTGGRTLQGFSIGSDTNATAYNLVMGQMMESRTDIKLKTYGIQMMDHTGKEYFALGFNTETGASYNKIANWKFDSNALWTGSSSIQSDGYTADTNGIMFSNGDIRAHKFKVVDGRIYAVDGNFSGSITGSTITGGSININNNFEVNKNGTIYSKSNLFLSGSVYEKPFFFNKRFTSDNQTITINVENYISYIDTAEFNPWNAYKNCTLIINLPNQDTEGKIVKIDNYGNYGFKAIVKTRNIYHSPENIEDYYNLNKNHTEFKFVSGYVSPAWILYN